MFSLKSFILPIYFGTNYKTYILQHLFQKNINYVLQVVGYKL